MSIHELILKVSELETICITCPRAECGTEIVFKASLPVTIGIAKHCPNCSESMEQAGACAAMYRTFYQQAISGKLQISFRVQQALEK
jgi:hypothetical protein